MDYFFYILLAAIFLSLNAIFNGAETGLVTLDIDYLKFKVRNKSKASKENRLLQIARSPENYLAVTLLGINSCLVVSTALLTVVLEKLGPMALQIGTLVNSIVIFFACEFLPKLIFSDRPLKFCLKILPILVIAEFIFYLPVKMVTFLTRKVMKFLNLTADKIEGRLSREELLILLTYGLNSGTLEESSSKMAKGIIELRERYVKEIMIPRPQVFALEINTPINVARKTVIQSGFSRVPVYDKEIDRIVGILYFKDLFLKGDKIKSLKDIMLKPLFVPEMKPAIELLREMRAKASQVAIIVDEYSSVCGIVTFEDLVEEVVGEIHDEFDKPHNKIKYNDDGSITVRGDVPLSELNQLEEFNFTSIKGATTINGLIQAYLGKIPCTGESFIIEGYRMRIIASDERKIEWIKILRIQVEK